MGELGAGANTSKPSPHQQEKGSQLTPLEQKGIETLIDAGNNPVTAPTLNLGMALAKLLGGGFSSDSKPKLQAGVAGASGAAPPNSQQWMDAFQQR